MHNFVIDCIRHSTATIRPFEPPVNSFSFGGTCFPFTHQPRLSMFHQRDDLEHFQADVLTRHCSRIRAVSLPDGIRTKSRSLSLLLGDLIWQDDEPLNVHLWLARRLAARGSPIAAFYLAKEFTVTHRAITQGLHFLRMAADGGYPDAIFQSAIHSFIGFRETANFVKAHQLFEKAAQKGHPGAMIWLGLMAGAGIGTEKNREKALEMLIRAMETRGVWEWRAVTKHWEFGTKLNRFEVLRSIFGKDAPRRLVVQYAMPI
jgi:hypothetical protein